MSTSTTTTTAQKQQLQNLNLTSAQKDAPKGSVQAELVFFKDPEDGAKPFNYVGEPPAGQPQRNYGTDSQILDINDIRDSPTTFSLDTAGFAALPDIPSVLSYEDFEDDETIKAKYYPEIEKLLLEKTPGAPNRVFIFDHTIRRTRPGSNREPVTRAHIDQTAPSTTARVHFHLPDEADELLKSRVRIINVWRPLAGPVRAFPLAMADSRSVPADDLVGVEHRYPDRTGETAGVRSSKGQEWWYLSGMNTDERILLQCFDTRGTGARVAHSAFVDPRSEVGEGRESIEVRALVFD
jgi:hypothetical protein